MNFLKYSPIIIYISYDKKISSITNSKSETLSLRPNTSSEEFLSILFNKYPALLKQAVPGTLIHKINGAPAHAEQKLQTGDYIEMSLISLRKLRSSIKKDIDFWAESLGLRFSSEDVINFIYNSDEKGMEKIIDEFLKDEVLLEDPLVIEELSNTLLRAWNSFPQKRLKGKSAMQVLHKEIVQEILGDTKDNQSKLSK